MKIVPSLLAEEFDTFLLRVRQAESFADYVQVDLMDGVFVPTKSFPPDKINIVETRLFFEAHIMVKDPLPLIKRIRHPGLRKVIFHFESEGDQPAVIDTLRERGLDAGIAVNPETEIGEIGGVAKEVDTLLFLTVDPCCYGSPFKPEVLEKIGEARQLFPDKAISVDGGVSLDNLKMLFDLGVDYACVGSRIFLKGNPGENYRRFVDKVRELENEKNHRR